ncbi:hypothetical protein NEOLEDRAFT_1178628 [Neolentinus lepideus HHB14362 ss-1]|uniref:Uncharacterized protein n=1 Tax=Neolentinus lepideus HHB14362 ss-1 TaxID=1314782 RepID=A0A165SIM6_9AGAM|nr:hypothetical protein NEOLEDRAFT_1178628 [Neolentinus lepideus HHB14362 ss-1]
MGSTSSTVLVAGLVGAAALAYGYTQFSKPHTPQPGGKRHPDTSVEKLAQTAQPSKKSKRNKKEKKGASTLTPEPETKHIVVPFPPVAVSIPGDFDSGAEPLTPTSEPQAKVKKAKKKKAKKVATPVPGNHSDSSAGSGPSSLQPLQQLAAGSKPEILSVDTDGSWTQVSSHSRKQRQETSGDATALSAEHTSDAGLAASSVGERSDEEVENRKTLAEKLLPKPRKTGVEDMTETPDHPGIARVMRVQPPPGEKPAAGFSWGDYEDVDADGEDDGGWGVVKNRSRRKATTGTQSSTPEFKAPESLTKKQRQNAAKREAQKTAKAQAEAERLALLAKHKRELERQRMAEQAASQGKKTSGGMTATVDEKGKLVWE